MIKQGSIIENYQGRFAKVVSVTETRFGLTPWFVKREQAEEETRVVRYLNEFGLSQVMAKSESEGTDDGGDGEKPLSKMTVKELKAIAAEMGLPTDGKQAELVAAIEAKRAEGTDDGGDGAN